MVQHVVLDGLGVQLVEPAGLLGGAPHSGGGRGGRSAILRLLYGGLLLQLQVRAVGGCVGGGGLSTQ